MKRTKLSARILPDYSPGEECMNTVTHIVGAGLALAGLVLCVLRAVVLGNGWGIVSSVVYGVSMVALYTVSSVYHGLRPGMGKKVMQVVDHCTIYFLIAGTYTPVVLGGLRQAYPQIAWGLFFFEWILAAVACTLTAIDLERYNVFSMICYIGMGWAVIPFARVILEVMTAPGFRLLLWGGIAYTVGAVLYGLGETRKWMHSVFHIFVVLGSVLQFFAVFFYTL